MTDFTLGEFVTLLNKCGVASETPLKFVTDDGKEHALREVVFSSKPISIQRSYGGFRGETLSSQPQFEIRLTEIQNISARKNRKEL